MTPPTGGSYVVPEDYSGKRFGRLRFAARDASIQLVIRMKTDASRSTTLADKSSVDWDQLEIDGHAEGSRQGQVVPSGGTLVVESEVEIVSTSYNGMNVEDFLAHWDKGTFRPYVTWPGAPAHRRYLREKPYPDEELLLSSIATNAPRSRVNDPIDINGGEVGVILDASIPNEVGWRRRIRIVIAVLLSVIALLAIWIVRRS